MDRLSTSSYTGVTNFKKQSGLLAHPVHITKITRELSVCGCVFQVSAKVAECVATADILKMTEEFGLLSVMSVCGCVGCVSK